MAASQKSVKSAKRASKPTATRKKRVLKDLPSVKANKVLGGVMLT